MKDWPKCRDCGKNLIFISPGYMKRDFYGCVCGYDSRIDCLGAEMERPLNDPPKHNTTYFQQEEQEWAS